MNSTEVKEQQPIAVEHTFDRYSSEDDDTITDTGRTLSSINDQPQQQQTHDSPFSMDHHQPNNNHSQFEKVMKDTENGRISRYQNTYFMDGGNRFISVSFSLN